MILNLIQEYLTQKTAKVNANLDGSIVLKQVITELDLDYTGNSESYIHYQAYITEITAQDDEAQIYKTVNVSLEFIINIANKNYTVYKNIFDRYIFPFMRVLQLSKQPLIEFKDGDISTGLSLIDIYDVRITNANRFEDEYYKPTIEFTLMISDSGIEDILKAEAV